MFIVLLYISVQQSKHIHRSPKALMNTYYRLKNINPEAAYKALKILLAEDNTYLPAIIASRQWEYEHGFLKAKSFKDVFQSTSLKPIIISSITKNIVAYKEHGDGSLAYKVKIEPKKFFVTHKISDKKPYLTNIFKFKESGFKAIKQKNLCKAINYLTKAYQISHEPSLAMQLGYLYDLINNKPLAYKYFSLAAKTKEKSLSLKAENAMTNLSGLQTKALPAPYYSEFFFNPFSQTRFGLTVRPMVIRLGIEQVNPWFTKEYAFFRRTDDNQSMNLGKISQIYEDDVQITGIGGQITPIKGLPLVGFLETGVAYDLIYRNRNRYRGDLRAGFMYYDEYGARPAYFDRVFLSLNYYSDLYGEATYFSRYNNNVIAGVKTHQGIRLLQYHSSMLNLYATGRVITDVQRQFYNNFAEIGPGIELVPTNRFNVKIRFEHVNGVYLPAGATPNPYSQYYTNTLVQLLVYIKV